MSFKFFRSKLTKAKIELVSSSNNISKVSGSSGQVSDFYLNPDSWQESKSAKWAKHTIPGLSDDIQQWVGSSSRTITFKALVTNDVADGHIKTNKQSIVSSGSVKQVFSKIAAQVFNIPGISNLSSLEQGNQGNRGASLNLDITEQLNFYRSLTYPITSNKTGKVDFAPNLIKLYVGTTFGKRNQLFVVDKIDIEITKQTPDLKPMEAIVTFSLTEYVTQILSADSNIYTDK
jgi:hypothetical protein